MVVGRRQGDFLFFFCRSLKRADKRFFFSYRDSGERREGGVVLLEYPVAVRVVVEPGGVDFGFLVKKLAEIWRNVG
ncbi:MAG: hypothetical protein J6Y20_04790 [Lachnospiraceae bacterium]|nr:hypothetical protein [Lachnospiraceae bacterium]